MRKTPFALVLTVGILHAFLLAGVPASGAQQGPSLKPKTPAMSEELMGVTHDAFAAAAYDCMTRGGVATPDDEVAMLGDVTESGEQVTPSDPMHVSGGCLHAAASLVVEAIESAEDSSDTTVSSNLQELDVSIQTDGTAVEPVNVFQPYNNPPPPGGTGFSVSEFEFVAAMNRVEHYSLGRFWRHRNSHKPEYFIWRTDYCSNPLPHNDEFRRPCARHDFGWRNLKYGTNRFAGTDLWRARNKAVADYKFLMDMIGICDSAGSCAKASAYYNAVSHVWPVTYGMHPTNFVK